MKHISDNIKMNNLLLVLREKGRGHNEGIKSQTVEWITKSLVETLMSSGIALLVSISSASVAQTVPTDKIWIKIGIIVMGLVIAWFVYQINKKKVLNYISITIEDGRLKETSMESGILNLEKYVFPELVVAAECFETAEQDIDNGNCCELNIVWGEIALKKAIEALYNCAYSFKCEYDENAIYGGLSKYEIDELFDVINMIILKRKGLCNGELQNAEMDSVETFLEELNKRLDAASIKIRGRKFTA